MRISQCRISKSVHDFPFCRLYNLSAYTDPNQPAVFFGCYDERDLEAVLAHRSLAVIWWCGQDALDFKQWELFPSNVRHVTERLKVWEHLQSRGCKLLPCSNLAEPAEPTPLGSKIFAYCPASYPEYHGIELINELRSRGHDIILGDGSIPQNDWRAGRCNELYDQCFIGLVLSNFAGGGASVIELGLRGRKCVTNVVQLGNVINWRTLADIEQAIEREKSKIGTVCYSVRDQTLNTLDHTNHFLLLENYIR